MTNPVRVLHAAVNMNRGGAETFIMNLYRNIDRYRVQFDFLTCKDGVFDAEILELGGRVNRIPYITEAGHFGYLKALDGFFSAHREYKIVHSHMDKMSGFVLRAAKRAGVPVRVAHSHSTKSEGSILARTYKWYASHYIADSATNLMACSNDASKWLFKNLSPKALIVNNAIDIRKFAFSSEIRHKVRQDLGISEKAIVAGHVGRFSHPKNHLYLIDVFKEFQIHNSDSVLMLVGDGPLLSTIMTKATALGLDDKVKFLGVREDVNCLLQALDVFIFPSLYEGLPVSLVEAQCAGVPCLVSEVIPSDADMGLGLVEYLPLDNKKMWVEKLRYINIRPFSDKTSEHLREKGYDIQIVSGWIQDFYLNVTG